jgi:hypothetical protein
MIEAYAFLAAFTAQILVVSVLQPAWFTSYARAKAEAQLPGLDRKMRERFLTAYRAVNLAIAISGLGLLAWLFNHLRNSGWDLRPVQPLLVFYTVAQTLPLLLASLAGAWIKKKALKRAPPQARRTASLQRRGFFDIVPPGAIFLAVLGYVLFAAIAIYVQQHPFRGFAGAPVNIGMATCVYALNGFTVYCLLYRRKKWPLETPAYRLQAVETQVKVAVYTSIACIVFFSTNLLLRQLHLQSWTPFAMSVYFVIIMLSCSMMAIALRRQAETDRAHPAS